MDFDILILNILVNPVKKVSLKNLKCYVLTSLVLPGVSFIFFPDMFNKT